MNSEIQAILLYKPFSIESLSLDCFLWLEPSVTSRRGMEAESQSMNCLTFGPIIISDNFILDSGSCLNWHGELSFQQAVHAASSVSRPVLTGLACSCFSLYLDASLHCPPFHSELPQFPSLFVVSSLVSFSVSPLRRETVLSSGPSLPNSGTPI